MQCLQLTRGEPPATIDVDVLNNQQSKLSAAQEKADGAERDLLRHDRDEVI